MNQNFMKEQKILPLIATMSLPMVISMAVNALYNIVDSYFVAKISDDAMTALSLVFPIQNMVNAIAIGFGIGVNACIAFFLGAEKKDKADMSASWLFKSFYKGRKYSESGNFLFQPGISVCSGSECGNLL